MIVYGNITCSPSSTAEDAAKMSWSSPLPLHFSSQDPIEAPLSSSAGLSLSEEPHIFALGSKLWIVRSHFDFLGPQTSCKSSTMKGRESIWWGYQEEGDETDRTQYFWRETLTPIEKRTNSWWFPWNERISRLCLVKWWCVHVVLLRLHIWFSSWWLETEVSRVLSQGRFCFAILFWHFFIFPWDLHRARYCHLLWSSKTNSWRFPHLNCQNTTLSWVELWIHWLLRRQLQIWNQFECVNSRK